MTKIQRISADSLALDFHSPSEAYDDYRAAFLATDLGKIYLAVPWNYLISGFELKLHKVGPKARFTP